MSKKRVEFKVEVHVPLCKYGIKVEHGAIHHFVEWEHENLKEIAQQIYMTEEIWAFEPIPTNRNKGG